MENDKDLEISRSLNLKSKRCLVSVTKRLWFSLLDISRFNQLHFYMKQYIGTTVEDWLIK